MFNTGFFDPIQDKAQVDKFEFEGRQKSFNTALKQLEELNEEHRKTLADYYNKILFYSVGAFSFTVALIGLVVKDKAVSLAKIGFLFPNVYWLYFSWCFFLLASVLALLSQKMYAFYALHFGFSHYYKKGIPYQEEILRILEKDQVLLRQNLPEAIAFQKTKLAKLTGVEKKETSRRDFYFKLLVWCRQLSEISVLIAVLLLSLFSIQLTQAITWG